MKAIWIAYSLICLLFSSWPAYASSHLWAIKCLGIDGHSIHVKAFTHEGKTYDIKAIPSQKDSSHTLFLYAVTQNGKKFPIKITKNYQSEGFDLKAITNGLKAHIRGVIFTGRTIDVKASPVNSNQFNIYCMTSKNNKLKLKAISPNGEVYNVKNAKNLPGKKSVIFNID